MNSLWDASLNAGAWEYNRAWVPNIGRLGAFFLILSMLTVVSWISGPCTADSTLKSATPEISSRPSSQTGSGEWLDSPCDHDESNQVIRNYPRYRANVQHRIVHFFGIIYVNTGPLYHLAATDSGRNLYVLVASQFSRLFHGAVELALLLVRIDALAAGVTRHVPLAGQRARQEVLNFTCTHVRVSLGAGLMNPCPG